MWPIADTKRRRRAAARGVGALFLVELPPKIETVAYYALFTLGFISAVVYNIISLKKGRWLFRRMKEEAKRRAGKNGGK